MTVMKCKNNYTYVWWKLVSIQWPNDIMLMNEKGLTTKLFISAKGQFSDHIQGKISVHCSILQYVCFIHGDSTPGRWSVQITILGYGCKIQSRNMLGINYSYSSQLKWKLQGLLNYLIDGIQDGIYFCKFVTPKGPIYGEGVKKLSFPVPLWQSQ